MSDTYRVDGMTCEGCAKSVTRALSENQSGVSVSVDLAAKTVSVTGLTEAQVSEAVEAAGFDFVGKAG
ncbi:MAG: heavy-metal-associated domain-containing protein [Rhodospirillales bacterium]